MRTSATVILAAGLLAVCPACFCSSPNIDPLPSRCEADVGSGTFRDSREVAVGYQSGDWFLPDGGQRPQVELFQAWTDGGDAELVAGFQGGYMVQPMIRVAAGDATDPQACYSVRLRNRVRGADLDETSTFGLDFDREGDFYYARPFDDLLGFTASDLDDQAYILDVTVTGRDFESATTLHLTLRY